ncbi:MAG TPA: aspartate kinase [Candidatus Bilamarchaeaceae archaeon]|nr:aspartate kinase [Candidatus Bilamarchaeaceae archaeon]
MFKVVKFGGSSLASADLFKQVAEIIQSDKDRKVVVVSAPGRSNPNDSKTTDLLIKISENVLSGKAYSKEFDEIKERLINLEKELDPKTPVANLMTSELQKRIKKREKNAIIALGEEFSARLLADYLEGSVYLDPKDANFLIDETPYGKRYVPKSSFFSIRQVFNKLKDKIVIFPGFFGIDSRGRIRVLQRGGSDYTASILSVILNADLHENFTDVDGISVVEPDILPDTEKIRFMSLYELSELTLDGSFGVFQDFAVAPLARNKIQIHVLSTKLPKGEGTRIVETLPNNLPKIRGIACKKDFVIFDIFKYGLDQEIGLKLELEKIFANHKLSVGRVPSSLNSMSIILSCKLDLSTLSQEIKDAVKPDELRVINDVALVSVVGEELEKTKGVGMRILKSISDHDINILKAMFDGINFVCVIPNNEAKKAVKAIYEEFFA